jgi:hypothetical protein
MRSPTRGGIDGTRGPRDAGQAMTRVTTMLPLRPAALALLLPALPVHAGELPLTHGFYVRTDAACSAADAGNASILRPSGLLSLLDECRFGSVTDLGGGRFEVVQTCAPAAAPEAGEEATVIYSILAEGAWRVESADGWSYDARPCPQSELPEPFAGVDLEALLVE